MEYHAPLADIRFFLQYMIADEERSRLNAYESLDDDLVDAVLTEAARFAEQELAPLNATGDQQGCLFEGGQVKTPPGWVAAFQAYRDSGWPGISLPTDVGGQALPKLLATPVTEYWQSANLSFSMIQALTDGAVEALIASGNQTLVDRYAEHLVTGDWTATMALTEPAAGSDLGLLKTKAVPDANGGYRIFGQKLFITYGRHDMTERQLHLVLARLPDAQDGSRGISLFAVPSHLDEAGTQLNDVLCTGIEHKMGLHGSPTCSLSFGEQNGAWGELIGEPGRGLSIMFVMMNEARLSVGVQGLAIAERAYQAALDWANQRQQGRHFETGEGPTALVNHPDVRRLLLRMRSQILASRFLAYRIAFLIDQSRQPDDSNANSASAFVDLLTPVFKGWSSEVGNRLTSDAIQVFGGMGFIEETGVAQYYRDLKISTIYEGTTGIQAQDFLFRKVMRDGGQVFFNWLNRVEKELSPLLAIDAVAKHAQTVISLAQDIANTTRTLMNEGTALQQHSAAVALLESCGVLASAWQLGCAVAAVQKTETDSPIEKNRVPVFAFYCAHWLPTVRTNLERVSLADTGIADYEF